MRCNDDAAQRGVYWNEFYSRKDQSFTDAPSKFADFVAGELRQKSIILEFGCGNGRDSIFLAKSGHELIALDGSLAAIEQLNCRISSDKISNIKTFYARIDEKDLGNRLRAYALTLDRQPSLPVVVYARFFLHALTEDEQSVFLAVAAQLLRHGGLLAVEFRTCEDRLGTKVTPPHYRRYVDPETFIQDTARLDLHPLYFQQGRGLARQGVDDAHVARIILSFGGKAA